MWLRLPLFLALTAGLAGCRERSGALTPAQRERFAAEGIRHQADDLVFRYTDHPGRRDARWEDRLASIVVTGTTVLVHKNEKVGVEITPRTRRYAAVERSGNRVRIRTLGPLRSTAAHRRVRGVISTPTFSFLCTSTVAPVTTIDARRSSQRASRRPGWSV